jgi:nucleosome assembly protein 1-like 1
MEGNDSHELRVQETKAEEELSKLPEPEKVVLKPVLELQKQRNSLFLSFLDELRALEYKYDQKYQPLYDQRVEISKKTDGFWLKILKNNPMTSSMIFDQDENLLKYLIDIKHTSEIASDNFTLEFYFLENPVIENTILQKKYFMGSDDQVERTEGTEIKWKGANLTQKIKKTKKKGKNKKPGIKVEEIPSFFSFFKNLSEEDNEEDSEDEELGGALEDDYEMACEFRDEIIPNAIYYYLGVRDSDESDEENENNPKSKKIDASGNEKPDCKQQ